MGKEKRPRYKQALEAQMYATSNDFDTRLKAAKKHGLHPLVALGVNTPPAPQPHYAGDTGSSVGQALSNAGQDVSRAVAAYQTKEQREEDRVLRKLSVERAGLENELLKSQIAGSRAQLAPAHSINPDPRYPDQSQMPLGYGDTAPFLRMGKDSKGNPIRVYNDDLGDNELLQALTAIGMSVPDYIHGNLGRPTAKKLRKSWDWLGWTKKGKDYTRLKGGN